MNRSRLDNIISGIDLELVNEALNYIPKKHSGFRYIAVAAMLVLTVSLGSAAYINRNVLLGGILLNITDTGNGALCETDRPSDTDEINTPAGTEISNPDVTPEVGGGTGGCPIHTSGGYHFIDASLMMAFTTQEEMDEWDEKHHFGRYAPGECAVEFTITNFIKDFNISKEDFLKNYRLYQGSYNVDLLYSGTEEEISAYYASDEAAKYGIRYENYFELCGVIHGNLEEWLRDKPNYMLKSVPFMVKELNMDRGTLESIIEKAAAELEPGREYVYDYDLDVIYNEDGSIKEFPRFEGYNDLQNADAWADVFCSLREAPET